MLLRMLLATAVLATAAQASEANFERTLSVSAQPELFVATGSGHIRITQGSDSQIHIKGHLSSGWHMGPLSGGSGHDVEERMRRIVQNPPIRQEGNTVRAGDTGHEDHQLFENISIDYDITAPKGVTLDLHSGSGDLEAENVGRSLKADTGSGSVRAHGLSGAADLRTGSGDIELRQSGAGEVHATTSSGSIHIEGLSGGLTARTGSGDIEVGGSLRAAARLQSGSGSIRLHLGRGARFNIQATTGSGSIRVPGTSGDGHDLTTSVNGGGPLLEVHTGSGDIEVN